MEWGSIAAIAATVIAAAGFFAAWVVRINKGESANESVKQAHERIDKHSRELSEFKEHVAREYASKATLDQMETRIINVINRLGDRFDRLMEKLASKEDH